MIIKNGKQIGFIYKNGEKIDKIIRHGKVYFEQGFTREKHLDFIHGKIYYLH